MKKTLCILCVSLCLCTLLLGCGAAKECQHQWAEADCLTPSRCTLCAAEQGEALGHDWQEPSCESPQRCSRCGAEQGQATGHIWLDASCESPERCGSCGETRGDKAEHRYGAEASDEGGVGAASRQHFGKGH